MNSSSTEFTKSDGRRFAFPVGVAFLLLAGLLLWRDKEVVWFVAGGLGITLIVAGALVPGRLGPVYRGWMNMALRISKLTTPIFMGIVFFLVLTPTALLLRGIMGKRPIRNEPRDGSLWQPTDRSHSDLRRQF